MADSFIGGNRLPRENHYPILRVTSNLRKPCLVLCDKVYLCLAAGRCFSLILGFPPQIKLSATIERNLLIKQKTKNWKKYDFLA